MTADAEIGRPDVLIESREDVGYRIRRLDQHQFVLDRYVRPGTKPNGKTSLGRWTNAGYFPKLEQAAQAMLDALLLEGEKLPTLEELRADVQAARERVLNELRDAHLNPIQDTDER